MVPMTAQETERSGPLDDIDRRLVALLVEDGRMSVNELAARLHVSRATAYARLRRLRQDGVITGFTARVDPARAGLGVTAIVLCSTQQGRWRDLRDELAMIPGIEHVFFTTGAFDFVLVVRVADAHELRDVVLEQLQSFPEIRSTQTMFALDELRPVGR